MFGAGLSLYLWKQPHYKALVSSLVLSKCLVCRLWEDSQFLVRQLPGIGPALAALLVGAGKTSLQSIVEANPRDLERIVNRHPPFGNTLQEAVWRIPRFSLSLRLVEGEGQIQVSVEVVNPGVNPQHSVSLVVGDSSNQILLQRRFQDSSWTLNKRFTANIPRKVFHEASTVEAHLISDSWAGIDEKASLTLTKPAATDIRKFTQKMINSRVLTQQNVPSNNLTVNTARGKLNQPEGASVDLSRFEYKPAKKISTSNSSAEITQRLNFSNSKKESVKVQPQTSSKNMCPNIREDSPDFDFPDDLNEVQTEPSLLRCNDSTTSTDQSWGQPDKVKLFFSSQQFSQGKYESNKNICRNLANEDFTSKQSNGWNTDNTNPCFSDDKIGNQTYHPYLNPIFLQEQNIPSHINDQYLSQILRNNGPVDPQILNRRNFTSNNQISYNRPNHSSNQYLNLNFQNEAASSYVHEEAKDKFTLSYKEMCGTKETENLENGYLSMNSQRTNVRNGLGSQTAQQNECVNHPGSFEWKSTTLYGNSERLKSQCLNDIISQKTSYSSLSAYSETLQPTNCSSGSNTQQKSHYSLGVNETKSFTSGIANRVPPAHYESGNQPNHKVSSVYTSFSKRPQFEDSYRSEVNNKATHVQNMVKNKNIDDECYLKSTQSKDKNTNVIEESYLRTRSCNPYLSENELPPQYYGKFGASYDKGVINSYSYDNDTTEMASEIKENDPTGVSNNFPLVQSSYGQTPSKLLTNKPFDGEKTREAYFSRQNIVPRESRPPSAGCFAGSDRRLYYNGVGGNSYPSTVLNEKNICRTVPPPTSFSKYPNNQSTSDEISHPVGSMTLQNQLERKHCEENNSCLSQEMFPTDPIASSRHSPGTPIQQSQKPQRNDLNRLLRESTKKIQTNSSTNFKSSNNQENIGKHCLSESMLTGESFCSQVNLRQEPSNCSHPNKLIFHKELNNYNTGWVKNSTGSNNFDGEDSVIGLDDIFDDEDVEGSELTSTKEDTNKNSSMDTPTINTMETRDMNLENIKCESGTLTINVPNTETSEDTDNKSESIVDQTILCPLDPLVSDDFITHESFSLPVQLKPIFCEYSELHQIAAVTVSDRNYSIKENGLVLQKVTTNRKEELSTDKYQDLNCLNSTSIHKETTQTHSDKKTKETVSTSGDVHYNISVNSTVTFDQKSKFNPETQDNTGKTIEESVLKDFGQVPEIDNPAEEIRKINHQFQTLIDDETSSENATNVVAYNYNDALLIKTKISEEIGKSENLEKADMENRATAHKTMGFKSKNEIKDNRKYQSGNFVTSNTDSVDVNEETVDSINHESSCDIYLKSTEAVSADKEKSSQIDDILEDSHNISSSGKKLKPSKMSATNPDKNYSLTSTASTQSSVNTLPSQTTNNKRKSQDWVTDFVKSVVLGDVKLSSTDTGLLGLLDKGGKERNTSLLDGKSHTVSHMADPSVAKHLRLDYHHFNLGDNIMRSQQFKDSGGQNEYRPPMNDISSSFNSKSNMQVITNPMEFGFSQGVLSDQIRAVEKSMGLGEYRSQSVSNFSSESNLKPNTQISTPNRVVFGSSQGDIREKNNTVRRSMERQENCSPSISTISAKSNSRFNSPASSTALVNMEFNYSLCSPRSKKTNHNHIDTYNPSKDNNPLSGFSSRDSSRNTAVTFKMESRHYNTPGSPFKSLSQHPSFDSYKPYQHSGSPSNARYFNLFNSGSDTSGYSNQNVNTVYGIKNYKEWKQGKENLPFSNFSMHDENYQTFERDSGNKSHKYKELFDFPETYENSSKTYLSSNQNSSVEDLFDAPTSARGNSPLPEMDYDSYTFPHFPSDISPLELIRMTETDDSPPPSIENDRFRYEYYY